MSKPVPAGVEDAPALAALHATAFTGDEAWDADAMAELLEGLGCYALWVPGQGFIMARAIAGEAEVMTIAVAPGFRRQGLGAALMRGAIQVAKAYGAETIFLEAAENNNAALQLYHLLGFEKAGIRRRYYSDGTDALLLSLNLC
jgi:ribosomal-protein-alanine N-acetyltransferase